MQRYNPKEIEPKWQQIWDETGVYTADLQSSKPKYIAMSMFNYPSGNLHIGHAMNFTISDVKARFKRQQGYESYHPVGWDSFGLPAENRAIKEGMSPQQSMAQLIPEYRKIYKTLGWSNDWEKEISTHLPEYYKWTQWIFTQMFKHGLAYQDSRMQWWCEKDATVLANEQVIDGKCWRHDGPDDPLVEKKEIKQWFFKITEYADELLEATDELDWTEAVKTAQKNWIGKSVGAEVEFEICHSGLDPESSNVKDTLKFTPELTAMIQSGEKWSTIRLEAKQLQIGDYAKLQTRFSKDTVKSFAIAKITKIQSLQLKDIPLDLAGHEKYDTEAGKLADYQGYYGSEITAETEFTIYDFEVVSDIVTVFTTRPDTLFGATFLVLAPEHELVAKLTTAEQKSAVDKYVQATAKKTEVERQASKEKTGVFTGAYAVNPVNGEKIPVWIADYVLTGYGTGAIMAVPAHDERDYEFAKRFDLPIQQVIAPETGTKRDNEQFADGGSSVVFDPKTQKYAFPRFDTNGNTALFAGGRKEGEDLHEGILRELREESGLTHIKQYEEIAVAYGHYYHSLKKLNRRARATALLVILEDAETIPTQLEAHEKFHLEWLDAGEVLQTWKDDDSGNYDHYILFLRHAVARAIELGFDTVSDPAVFTASAITGEGVLVHSGPYDGMESSEAREKIVADLEAKGSAVEKTNYKMRDWSVSRQRYWGAPIPVIHCSKDGAVLVPDDQLPVILPELDDFAPAGDGRSALARATDWLNVTCPECGGPAERETDTLDTYICSSWYMLRYMDPHNQQAAFSSDIANKWMPIDFYNGGDHATAHLLYARFVTRFFSKLGLVENPEPFEHMLYNGKVTAADGKMFSKSKGNGIDPLEIINQGYGADALRTYLMFAAPLELWARWDPQGVPGTHRFLSRVWTIVGEYTGTKPVELSEAQIRNIRRSVHGMIKKMTDDIEHNRYNTAISAAMTCVNELYKLKTDTFGQHEVWQEALASLVACIGPFAPHISEELWHQLGHSSSVNKDSWPLFDEQYLASDTITVAVQVNGKLRGTVDAPAGSDEAAATELAKADAKIAANLEGKQIIKTIYVAGKLLNFVVR